MSIEHRAYLFRYSDFHKELADPLYQSLQSGDIEGLRRFINQFRKLLTDVATEESLSEDWDEKYGQDSDVQDFADIALTKYYDLTSDLGLSYGWDALAAYFDTISELAQYADLLIGGKLFGPKGQRLDPGRMGTGLLSSSEADELEWLLSSIKWPTIPAPESEIYSDCYYKPDSVEDVQQSLGKLIKLYRCAAETNLGILLVDFNDRGVSHL